MTGNALERHHFPARGKVQTQVHTDSRNHSTGKVIPNPVNLLREIMHTLMGSGLE